MTIRSLNADQATSALKSNQLKDEYGLISTIKLAESGYYRVSYIGSVPSILINPFIYRRYKIIPAQYPKTVDRNYTLGDA